MARAVTAKRKKKTTSRATKKKKMPARKKKTTKKSTSKKKASKKKATKKKSLSRSRKKKTTYKKKARKTTKKKKAKATKKSTTKKRKTTSSTRKKTKATKRKTGAKKASSSTQKSAKVIPLEPRPIEKLGSLSAPQPAETAFEHKLEVGQIAPDFSIPDQNGEMRSLSEFRGKNVVLYFYPKDDTPGCTKEACSFRDHMEVLREKDAVVIGVSQDSQQSHQKFIEKYGLNFLLLSDQNKEVAEKYQAYVQKNMYGKVYWGIQRSTFVIDKQGRLAAIFPKVSVDGHTQEVLEVLASLEA